MKVVSEEGMFYQCKECGFKYAEKEWAEKCEAWCKKHHTCNIEITSHAVTEEQEIAEKNKKTKSVDRSV